MQTSARRVIAYSLPWDDAPVDLSFVFAGEKPAGRHGFLQVRGGKFLFEDGAPGRFWGVNFNSAANFPSHAHSEIVARRLARFGVNLVRFHQLDGDWSTPNIFQFTRGARLENTRRLDPESLDRLDYLVHCLKGQGIYIYLDLLTYRAFRGGDGVAAADQLPPAARPYSNFDPRLIELQREFNEQIWTHVNPHTGLAFKDDPAIVLTEIANENELLNQACMRNLVEPYRSQLAQLFRAWAERRGLPPAADPVDFTSGTPAMLAFLCEIQREYYTGMIRHLRGLGVRIPIAGTNWAAGGAPLMAAQRAADFTDGHTYWYEWGVWRAAEKRFKNRSMLGERDPWFRGLTFCRFLDRPFFVSEWDDPWPNEWRAESPLYLAAAAALQGWAGAAIHTYRYDCREHVDQIAAPITSDALAGVPYRGGVFDTFNDPAKFGLFYHAALILRRGDVRESDAPAEVVLPDLPDPAAPVPPGKTHLNAGDAPALAGAAEVRKVGIRFAGDPAGAPLQAPLDRPLVPENLRELVSDTGELYRNLDRRYATIDTPRTKAAYGFLGAAGAIVLRGFTVRAHTDFGVIALSSLTEAPVAESDNLLLTAVGRADNAGAEYNADHTIQFNRGHGPIQAEVIEAELEISTRVSGLKIFAVNTAGALIGQVPLVVKDGAIAFALGGPFPSIYYLIQRQ